MVAEAVFHNREEIGVLPLWQDPIHDFGFFRLSRKLQFMECNEISLAPQAAAVGLDIRVVGNDSGEKVRGNLAEAGCCMPANMQQYASASRPAGRQAPPKQQRRCCSPRACMAAMGCRSPS